MVRIGQIFVPYAAMCQTLGCRYLDFLRPLREAAERESQNMHRVPPRGVTDENGNLDGIQFALGDLEADAKPSKAADGT